MTIERDHDRFGPVAVSSETGQHVQATSLYDGITGRVAVGRYLLQIGEPSGAVVCEASRTERAHSRPRPTPILSRPKSIRGLFGRQTELATALSALDAGLPIEASGESGIGKTAILRHLAYHPRAASFVDGVVYLSARHQSSADLLQLIFEAFYETDEIYKPTVAEIQRGLQDKQALILLDDVRLPPHELEQLLDIAPRSAFAVTTCDRCLWDEVCGLRLKGLPAEDAVLLLERESERSLDLTGRLGATSLCAALGGHPLRILRAAAITRELGIPFDAYARDITPASLITKLIASIDAKRRRVLSALSAVPGVPLHVQHVSAIAEVTDIEPSLMMLARLGVVVSSQSRHRLADDVGDQLRRTEDLNPWVNRAITYFTGWAERYRQSRGNLLEESEALLRVQQSAADNRRWGEVLRVGRLLEGALVLGARWGAWAITLEHCLAAAKALGDRSAEAWALHEIGTRAICLSDAAIARASLSQAVKLREAMGENDAGAASRRNLSFVEAPAPAHRGEREATPGDGVFDLDSFPLRDEASPAVSIPKTKRVGAVPLAAFLLAVLGALLYWAPAGRSWRPWNVTTIGSFLQGGLGGEHSVGATTPQPRQAAAELRVLQFSAVPEHIAPGESVRLCYDVQNATSVRIEPDIGEFGVLRRNCVSAAPVETTAYTLTADGAGGESVRQTVGVLVGIAASQEPQAAEPGSVPLSSALEAPADNPRPPPPAARSPASDKAKILIFSPRPGSIATGGPTELCYAVSGAFRARIEPGIGDVTPASTLTCVRVVPVRTTTYELTAYGRDGHQARQQLVIIVR